MIQPPSDVQKFISQPKAGIVWAKMNGGSSCSSTTNRTVFFLYVLVCCVICWSKASIPYNPYPACANQQHYYNSNSFQCIPCFSSTSTGTINDCTCSEGYMESVSSSEARTCIDCFSSGKASSRDRFRCMTCGSGSKFNAERRECVCDSQANILVETNNEKICTPCPENSVRDESDAYACIPCPDRRMIGSSGSCVCPAEYTLWNGNCLLSSVYQTIVGQYSIETASTVNYKQVYETMAQKRKVTPSSQSVQSNIIYQQFFSSATKCKQTGDVTACNNLANMCVVQLYDEQSSACKLFDSIISTYVDDTNGYPGWRSGMPWLTYSAQSGRVVSNDDIQMKVALNAKNRNGVRRLTYILSVYTWSGEWLGMRELTNELTLCPGGVFDQTRFLNFGSDQEIECRFNVQSLTRFENPEFYELYILDGSTLYPVPVQIFLEDKRIQKPKDLWPQNYQLYRRFFMYDNLVGKKANAEKPEVVRIAETIRLRVSLRDKTQERINPPILSIRYTSRKLKDVDSVSANFTTSDSETIYTPKISFSAEYVKNQKPSWISVISFISVSLIIAIVVSVYRVWQYIRRRQIAFVDVAIFGQLILQFCSVFSNLIFIILWCVTLYWYFFFKHQLNAFALLPKPYGLDLIYYTTIICVCLVGKIIEQIGALYRETSYDIFFIDWEKSRGKIVENRGRQGNYSPISMWRTVSIAKEWKKLSSLSVINLEFTLFFLLLLIYGFRLNNLATAQPNFKDITSTFQTNYALRFAIITIFWFAIAAVQFLYIRLFHYRFIRNPLTVFIDTCSLANISVFLLSESNFGYYIHGESVHPFADANMKEFNEYLQNERSNTVLTRGFLPDPQIPPIQSFSIYVSQDFRKVYNEKLADPIAHELLKSKNNYPNQTKLLPNQANQAMNNTPMHTEITIDRFFKLLDLGLGSIKRVALHPLTLFDCYHNLNEYLKQAVSEIKLKPDQVLDRQLTQRLGFEPDHSMSQKTYFYNDNVSYSFKRLLPMGSELSLLTFNIVLYGVVDVGANNPFASIIVVYLINLIIRLIRHILLQRNICSKTLLDERFLVN